MQGIDAYLGRLDFWTLLDSVVGLIRGVDDHLLGAVGGGSGGVGLSGSTNQRHGWCLVRGSDRGQVSLITPRDEVIRQFRFHDPPKNLPLYKRGEAGLR